MPANRVKATPSANERYPGMRALATSLFQSVPRTEHGELTRELKSHLEIAKSTGLATQMNWASETLDSLRTKFGSAGTQLNHSTNTINTNKSSTNQENSGLQMRPQLRSPVKQNYQAEGANGVKRRNHDVTGTPNNAQRYKPDKKATVEAKKKSREARFQTNSPSNQTNSPYLETQIIGDVVGTSEQLEKPYFRLTGQVNPAAVRPPHILEKSLRHVLAKYHKEQSYQYVASQLQSIRQDLTVQRIETALTVRVYEENARIALSNDDMGEFNKCLTRVMDLYVSRDNLAANHSEFQAYSLYYKLLLRKWNELSLILQTTDLSVIDSAQLRLPGPALNTKQAYPRTSEERHMMLKRALMSVHCVLRDNVCFIWQDTSMVWTLEYKLLGKIIERSVARGLKGLLRSTFQQGQSIPVGDLEIWMGPTQLERWNLPVEEDTNTVIVEKALPCIAQVVAQVDGKFDIKGQL